MAPTGAARGVLCAVEFIVLLACIALGSWMGGVGIGLAGGLGVLILSLCFRMPTGSIPYDVVSIIMCVIAAIASMQCAGGMDWLVSVAERAMKRHPRYITIVAPIITFLMTLLAGTGHSAYSTLPVIAEVAMVAGVRPSRAMTVSVTASQVAITASPISAAIVGFVRHVEGSPGISYLATLGVMIPSCFISSMITAVICSFLGKELVDDPIYADRWERGLCVGGPTPTKFLGSDLEAKTIEREKSFKEGGSDIKEVEAIELHSTNSLAAEGQEEIKPESATADSPPPIVVPHTRPKREYPKGLFNCPAEKVSVLIFCLSILFIVTYAVLISDTVGLATADVSLDRNGAILSGMLTAGLAICIICKNETAKVVQQPTFRTGMTAVLCVIGVAWMGDTFVKYYTQDIKDIAGDILTSQAWLLSVVLFVAGCLLYSQASTVEALYPLVVQVGISKIVALASLPAVNALFVLPTYPTVLAAVEMDPTGTTKIGKYVFNHSFLLPGFINIVLAILISFLFALMIIH
eukprot:Protomagalhaensia_sp_Gyna_25__5373@NODE_68_length_5665_cov_128_083185_g50_i0_p1_GENE_NODE_68_length_5665_cov_128_083185_g50_i0NODE_68_length_5665_cov_128_083185_g50_i0_p1_ORF_typecomplete_len521_score70_74DcuA_DcuB/PF03605_14/1e79DcuA_DcuB/PF03605_14/2_1e41DcuC/PF03606_15/9_7e08DcuC/PF03606_15/7_7e02MatC_N/PF07158_11/3_6e05MatC_N/PF07158_11/2_4e02MatC_N/PF07158_11/1_5e04CitMHS/PF03600_16/0_0084DUF2627/PF11118_8/9_6e03DUF2627/PF11118_8/7_1e03DUF2627/PF11118_8/1_6e04DUF2627/PF11118_8/0_071DUF575/P